MDPPAQHESEMVLYIPTPNDDDDDDKNCSLKSESMMSTSNDVLIAGTTDNENAELFHSTRSTREMSTFDHNTQPAQRNSVFQDIVDEFNESPVLAGALVTVDQDEIKEQHSYYSQEGGRELTLKKYDLLTGFDHCYVKVPWKERLSVLFATLRRSSERKVIVTFSSWESCQFHTILFRQLEMLQLFNLHENVANVAQAYIDFTYCYPGTLFASEIAMREFDIPPDVDYVVQYEPPTNPTEYIYRMNTAKVCDTSSHMALLFLTSEEMAFMEYFDDDVHIKELEARKISEIQRIAVKLVSKHDDLNELASNAFRAFMIAYKRHAFRDIYDYTKLQKCGVRASFGDPHLPEDLVEYFEYNQGAETATVGEKTQSITQYQESHQWMKKEKTWRKGHNVVLEDDHAQAQHQWRKKDKTGQRGQNQVVVGDGDRGGRAQKQYPWLVKRQNSSDDVNGEVGQKSGWMKSEKSWRSGQSKQSWMSKDEKTWKHTHINL